MTYTTNLKLNITFLKIRFPISWPPQKLLGNLRVFKFLHKLHNIMILRLRHGVSFSLVPHNASMVHSTHKRGPDGSIVVFEEDVEQVHEMEGTT